MGNSQNISAYFKDVATRHPDILHTDAQKRFYDLEWDELMQRGDLHMAEWSLVLEDYPIKLRDNDGDYISKLQQPTFYIGRTIRMGDADKKQETWEDAERIAMSIIGKMRADERARCHADVPVGVKPPRTVDLNLTSIMRVQIPGFDHAFGVRVVVGWRTDDAVELDANMVEWLPLT